MKLSELVAYRSALKQFDFYRDSRLLVKTILEAKAHVDDKVNSETNQQIKFGAGVYQDEMDRDLLRLEESISELGENFEYYKKQLSDIIQEQQQVYIKRSESSYISDELPNARLSAKERTLSMDDDNTTKFFDRIKQLTDWRYPGMIINPQEKQIVDDMASSDPLYLVDMNESTLDGIREKMNDVYRHRVSPYVINRFIPRRKYFGDLPTNQFGLIVVWNTINNLPLSMCDQVLRQLLDLLRPGGTLLFTFNDCENAHNIRNFENNFRQFTPGNMLVPMIENLGYTVRFRTETIHGWMELKKPGKLSTIRGGQSLGRVIRAKDAVVTDKKSYTREEQDTIINEAIALGVDKEDVIRKGAISIGKLELLVKRRKHAIEEERRLIEQIGKQNSKDS
jgi:SAM-dependent methyltransferase